MCKKTKLQCGISGVLAVALAGALPRIAPAQSAGFTIEQALSAPFTSELRAAASKGRLAWEANIRGQRNLWVAEPAGGKYTSRQVTHYTEDDGQELSAPEFTADAEWIVYDALYAYCREMVRQGKHNGKRNGKSVGEGG